MTQTPTPMATDKLIKKEKAAEILDVSIRTVERMISQGNLTKKKIRGCVRLYLSQVLQLASINSCATRS